MTDVSEDSTPAPAWPAVRLPWWQRPSVLALGFTVLLLGGALAWPLLRMSWAPPAAPATEQGLPWQIRPGPQGQTSEVFGLTLGQVDLGGLQQRWGDDLKLGLITPVPAQPGQPPALEAYVEQFRAGFITGKLVVALEAPADWRHAALDRVAGSEVGDGGRTRRHTLSADDLLQARRWPVAGLSFVPSARLDGEVVAQRFGPPEEKLQGPGGEWQWLYPRLGLVVVLPPAEGEGARAKAVLQYVTPQDFELRVRTPLQAALAASAAGR
ncbi:hypothetical protein [Ideonella livida]|uniref:Uncharacterized protein n=1 Tax=Ideonella livida TaxID=2707176 RepID=A0A7C9TKN1_9BURK|nr:hypothetical protein [Ideonella livida]NDY91683.1 hypothetical protein [Ideonella livida]